MSGRTSERDVRAWKYAAEIARDSSPDAEARMVCRRLVALCDSWLVEREALREVIGACAPPVESLLAVHGDGKYISPTVVEGLAEAAAALRKNVSLLALNHVELAS